MSPKQKKIAAKAPPKDKIDGKDFAVLKAEKAKGRGMGLQDEKVKPGKVMKASKGGESKDEKLRKAFPRKSPESRAKIETMLGSKNTPMKKERLFEGDKARRREAFKKIIKNVRKAIPGVGMLDVKVTKKSKGGGADMGTKMSDKRRKKLKDILSRLTAPRTINIKPEFKSGTSNPMQRDRKREGYRAKVEKAGGKVMFADEREMKKFKNFMGGGMMNKPMGYKKGASIMARGCKLGRKKATKLY